MLRAVLEGLSMQAKMIVDEWLDNAYEGGRHDRRVAQLMEIEG
jgi:ribose 5-phosphate isomerase RpiB